MEALQDRDQSQQNLRTDFIGFISTVSGACMGVGL